MKKKILKLLTLSTALNALLMFNWMSGYLSTDETIKVDKFSMKITDDDSACDSESNPNSRFHHEVKMWII